MINTLLEFLTNENIFSTPAKCIFSGVGNFKNKSGVTLLTEISVACALKMTDTNNSNGFRYKSSV